MTEVSKLTDSIIDKIQKNISDGYTIRCIIDPENNGHNDNLDDPFNLVNGDCNDELMDAQGYNNINDLKNILNKFLGTYSKEKKENHLMSIWKCNNNNNKDEKTGSCVYSKIMTILTTYTSSLPLELQRKTKKLSEIYASSNTNSSGKVMICLDTTYFYKHMNDFDRKSKNNYTKYLRDMYKENYSYIDNNILVTLKTYMYNVYKTRSLNNSNVIKALDILFSLSAIKEAHMIA